MSKYNVQKTTIWRFPERGSWETHKGDYRGNWSPHVPKNLILRYTKEGDVVLDPFVGSGTTMIECKLLNRIGIGLDVNNEALDITRNRTSFFSENNIDIELYNCSATNMIYIEKESIDLVCLHPPYSDIIKYSKDIENDLSLLNYSDFLEQLTNVAYETKRVLKKGKVCVIMIADIRKKGYIVPLGFDTLSIFQNIGFKIKDIIIKEQFNCLESKKWNKENHLPFHLIAHEYIFILSSI